MQNSSAFQNLAIDTIHESTTNPRTGLITQSSSALDAAIAVRDQFDFVVQMIATMFVNALYKKLEEKLLG